MLGPMTWACFPTTSEGTRVLVAGTSQVSSGPYVETPHTALGMRGIMLQIH